MAIARLIFWLLLACLAASQTVSWRYKSASSAAVASAASASKAAAAASRAAAASAAAKACNPGA